MGVVLCAPTKDSMGSVGDFNMVEHKIDMDGGLPHCWKGNEMYFWFKFKRKFNLVDPMENMHDKFQDIWFT